MTDQLNRLTAALADRYRIERVLGHGGMATVYLADDLKHDRQVAVKVLRPELASAVGSDRFLREIGIAARLQHPHILGLYDSGDADGFLYYVMPYVGKDSLLDRLEREGQLEVREAVRIVHDVVDALVYAHKQGVVHRDIKPANIMVTTRHAMVTDFGVAKAVSQAADQSNLTTAGVALGTPTYMAPEQVAADPDVDERADIYAVGVLAYELLAGRPPFASESARAVLAAHLTQEPDPLTTHRADVPPTLEAVVLKCLAKEPSDRWQTAEELLAKLDPMAVASGPIPPIAAPPLGRWRRRGPIGALAAIGALAVAAAALILARSGGQPGIEISPNTVAVLPFSVQGSSEFAYLREGMVNLLSTKLDGAGELRSVDQRTLLSVMVRDSIALLDLEQAKEFAGRFGAGLYVMGDVVEVGGRLRLAASLYNRSSAPDAVGSASVEGEADQVFSMVDDLAGQLLVSLAGGPAARVQRIAGVTTASLPAFKAYLEGAAAFRRGQFEPAVEAFRRAIQLDSLFALAHYRLSIAAEWATWSEVSLNAALEAKRFAGRLSERDQLLVNALVAWRLGDNTTAEQVYRSLVGTYPDDVEAWVELGEVLFHGNPINGRSIGESREAFERVLHYDPDHATALIHLARVAAHERRLADLDTLVDRALALNPAGDRVLQMQALRAFAGIGPTPVDTVVQRLERERDVTIALTTLAVASWDANLAGTRRLAALLTAPGRSLEERALGYAWIASVQVGRGQWRSAQAVLDSLAPIDTVTAVLHGATLAVLPFVPMDTVALTNLLLSLHRLDPGRIPNSTNPSLSFRAHNGLYPVIHAYLLALVSARLGDTEQALSHAERLAALEAPAGAGSLVTDLVLGVKAQIALHEGRRAEALNLLEQTRRNTWYQLTLGSPYYAQMFERFLRAELLYEAERDREALGWYGSISEISPYGTAYSSISHLRRGQIYERLGVRDSAITHYLRFTDLWRDADPELQPLLTNAETGLARLSALGE